MDAPQWLAVCGRFHNYFRFLFYFDKSNPHTKSRAHNSKKDYEVKEIKIPGIIEKVGTEFYTRKITNI